jgi:hypothetical protein
MKNTLLGIVLISLSFSLFSQETVSDFIKAENLDREKVVYFNLLGITDDNHKKALWNDLVADEKINEVIIENENSCKLRVMKDVTPDYLQKILDNHNVKINSNDLILSNSTVIEAEKPEIFFSPAYPDYSKFKVLPASFPAKVDTGNPYEDEITNRENFKKWREENPEDWQEMLENRNK